MTCHRPMELYWNVCVSFVSATGARRPRYLPQHMAGSEVPVSVWEPFYRRGQRTYKNTGVEDKREARVIRLDQNGLVRKKARRAARLSDSPTQDRATRCLHGACNSRARNR